jgi:hypothetical protein
MIAGETAQLSQRLVVLVYELHDKIFVIWLAPTIAINAACQHLSVRASGVEGTFPHVEAHEKRGGTRRPFKCRVTQARCLRRSERGRGYTRCGREGRLHLDSYRSLRSCSELNPRAAISSQFLRA